MNESAFAAGASSKAVWKKDLLVALVMIVWMAVVWRLFVRESGGQVGYYVGSNTGQFWKEHYFIPLLSRVTFLAAPFLGGCSAIRLMRSREPFPGAAGCFLFIVFAAGFLLVGLPLLSYEPKGEGLADALKGALIASVSSCRATVFE